MLLLYFYQSLSLILIARHRRFFLAVSKSSTWTWTTEPRSSDVEDTVRVVILQLYSLYNSVVGITVVLVSLYAERTFAFVCLFVA